LVAAVDEVAAEAAADRAGAVLRDDPVVAEAAAISATSANSPVEIRSSPSRRR
jgi:hypothetical protein